MQHHRKARVHAWRRTQAAQGIKKLNRESASVGSTARAVDKASQTNRARQALLPRPSLYKLAASYTGRSQFVFSRLLRHCASRNNRTVWRGRLGRWHGIGLESVAEQLLSLALNDRGGAELGRLTKRRVLMQALAGADGQSRRRRFPALGGEGHCAIADGDVGTSE